MNSGYFFKKDGILVVPRTRCKLASISTAEDGFGVLRAGLPPRFLKGGGSGQGLWSGDDRVAVFGTLGKLPEAEGWKPTGPGAWLQPNDQTGAKRGSDFDSVTVSQIWESASLEAAVEALEPAILRSERLGLEPAP